MEEKKYASERPQVLQLQNLFYSKSCGKKKKRRKKRVLQSLTVPSLVNIPWRDYDKQSSVLKCAFECLSRLNIPENCVNTVWEGAVAVM